MKSKIDYKEIIKLIDLLEERNLLHFELEVEGLKISIGRKPPAIAQADTAPVPVSPPLVEAPAAPVPEQKASEITKPGLHYITSPMVGTFYRSPDPASPPFIEPGENVSKNQTLCIIEAMKLMNEIEADTEGVIEEVFVKNGNPVEYGQKLFAIKPLQANSDAL